MELFDITGARFIAITVLLCSFALLVYSYFLYPVILSLIDLLICNRKDRAAGAESWLPVSILMAVHNEEDVLTRKLESILKTAFDTEKIELLIGSDCSTDRTNEILELYKNRMPAGYRYFLFSERTGKSAVINYLATQARHPVLIITDANVIFDADTISGLLSYFSDKSIGLVDTRIINTGIRYEGISIQESAYISFEVRIKNIEGRLWGTMTGPLGGCYALRKELFVPVPRNFLVDDFFICLHVIKRGYKAVSNLNAVVYEDVSNNIRDEFNRKVRIATGNFQNLGLIFALLFSDFRLLLPAGFTFLSHKVIRWFGPWLILSSWISAFFLLDSKFFLFVFVLLSFSFFIPLLDWLLQKAGIHFVLLRFITHFYAMNAATMTGFINYLIGVKTNVWKPTKRNQ